MSTSVAQTRSTDRVGAAETPSIRRRRRYDGWAPWLFIAPTVIGIGVFFLWPTVQSVYFSFTDWGVFGGTEWTGTDNYVDVLSDPALPKAIGNTLLYAAVSLVSIPLAVWLAALLNRPGLRFRSFFQVLFFLPVVTVQSAVAVVWRLLYNGEFGLINSALAVVGIDGPYWLTTRVVSVIAVAVVGAWMTLGFNMIILGAGLQAIPPDLYEAAELDGASPFRQLIHVTVPLLTPSIFFVTVMTLIGSFKVFDLVYLMIEPGNPVVDDSQTLVYLFFAKGFLANDKGYAAAVGVILLLIIALVTFLQFRLQRRWVHYD